MTFKTGSALAVLLAATLAGAASAQTPAAEWRTVAPENLLIIETAKGRVLVELEPRAAPGHVERIRTLATSGFYDGLKFHRVIPNFMAQTGDPQGTGQGGSDLPDIPAEIEFRRGRDSSFVPIPDSGDGVAGIMGSIPIQTQPDAQMMVTADFRVDANGLFCPGVAGMARSQGMDSANSQFFLMTGERGNLNGNYTVFGRVVDGLDAVKTLNAGLETQNGTVENPDVMTRVRMATQVPEAERPVVRVQTATSAAFTEAVAAKRAERGNNFSVCDVQPAVEVTGG